MPTAQILRGPHADVEIPDCSLPEYILSRLPRYGERASFVDADSGRGYSFAQIDQMIRSLATGFAQQGVRKGDVVAICTPNLPEYRVVFQGVAMLGAILTTANPLYTEDELAHQFADAGASVLFTIAALLPKLEAVAQRCNLQIIVIVDTTEHLQLQTLLQAAPMQAPVAIDSTTDSVVLPYSSGTTGRPKGVQLTHRNLVANLVQLEGATDNHRLDDTDVVEGVLPFFHICGLMALLAIALSNGAKVIGMMRLTWMPF